MRMPDDLFRLVQAFGAVYPPPFGVPGEEHDERCRAWTRQLAEQAVFAFPALGYGCKRASPDRPLSKDCIAQYGAQFSGWDVLIGAGTGAPALIGAPSESEDLTGQVFVAVPGHDWIGAAGASASPTPLSPSQSPSVDAPCCCCECLTVLKAELSAANEQRQALIALTSQLLTRLELTPTLTQLTATPIPVKLRW